MGEIPEEIEVKKICGETQSGTLIYLVTAGSHAYGLQTPESDIDFRGVFVPAAKYLFGLHSRDHISREDPDVVLKSLREFTRLAQDANPNILEQLFIPNPLYVHPLFQRFLDARHLFVSQRIRRTYVGYALGQLKKMQNGRSRDLGAKRKLLVEQFGYDTKNAMHCIRLLKQGKIALMTGEIPVMLPESEREYLKAVKRGEIFKTIEEVANTAMQMVNDVDNLDSKLPNNPQSEAIEKLLVSAHLEAVSDGIIGREIK
jgi:predicted nucleotidyltransferase